MNQAEQKLWDAGYQKAANPLIQYRDGNKEWWTAKQAGVWIPDGFNRYIICDECIPAYSVTECTIQFVDGKAEFSYRTMAIFYTVDEMVNWLSTGYGELSEPGLPAFSNSWD
jgi:hypothetical protein